MTEEKVTHKKPGKGKRGEKKQKKRIWRFTLIFLAVLSIAGILICYQKNYTEQLPVLEQIQPPDWIDQQLLVQNPYSRPGTKREQVRDIVVHYVANPGTSAMANRNYFNDLAKQTTDSPTSASSHFIIGIDGQIIQTVPLEEIAYANYPRNEDTISIECCHPDSTGEFTEETKESLANLVAWLCQELDLTERHLIRHYDVIGKNCPKYYVQDEEEWKKLKTQIKKKRKES